MGPSRESQCRELGVCSDLPVNADRRQASVTSRRRRCARGVGPRARSKVEPRCQSEDSGVEVRIRSWAGSRQERFRGLAERASRTRNPGTPGPRASTKGGHTREVHADDARRQAGWKDAGIGTWPAEDIKAHIDFMHRFNKELTRGRRAGRRAGPGRAGRGEDRAGRARAGRRK